MDRTGMYMVIAKKHGKKCKRYWSKEDYAKALITAQSLSFELECDWLVVQVVAEAPKEVTEKLCVMSSEPK